MSALLELAEVAKVAESLSEAQLVLLRHASASEVVITYESRRDYQPPLIACLAPDSCHVEGATAFRITPFGREVLMLLNRSKK